MPTLMSATTQPSPTGTTAQAAKASVAVTSGARRKITLLAPDGMIDFLEHELERVGEGLQQAEGADDVRAAAHLHRRPDLAVGEQDERDR